uniref:Uncharacterized protein n=1 Tax=Romanomermis culicivorax TaxID=13658 RepID=A0A915KR99_ROMCU
MMLDTILNSKTHKNASPDRKAYNLIKGQSGLKFHCATWQKKIGCFPTDSFSAKFMKGYEQIND